MRPSSITFDGHWASINGCEIIRERKSQASTGFGSVGHGQDIESMTCADCRAAYAAHCLKTESMSFHDIAKSPELRALMEAKAIEDVTRAGSFARMILKKEDK